MDNAMNNRYGASHQFALTIRIPEGSDAEQWVERIELTVPGHEETTLSVAMHCVTVYTNDIPSLVTALHRDGFDLGAP